MLLFIAPDKTTYLWNNYRLYNSLSMAAKNTPSVVVNNLLLRDVNNILLRDVNNVLLRDVNDIPWIFDNRTVVVRPQNVAGPEQGALCSEAFDEDASVLRCG